LISGRKKNGKTDAPMMMTTTTKVSFVELLHRELHPPLPPPPPPPLEQPISSTPTSIHKFDRDITVFTEDQSEQQQQQQHLASDLKVSSNFSSIY